MMDSTKLFWLTYFLVSGLLANMLFLLAIVWLVALWTAFWLQVRQQEKEEYEGFRQSLLHALGESDEVDSV